MSLLQADLPPFLIDTDVGVRKGMVEGMAYRVAQQFATSTEKLAIAEQLAQRFAPEILCEVLNAKGSLQVSEGQYAEGRVTYRRALILAQQYDNSYQQVAALVGLAWVAAREEQFDTAVDVGESALERSRAGRMQGMLATASGNLGWSYFQLGDFEAALDRYKSGAEISKRGGLAGYSAYWYTGVVNSYLAVYDYQSAETLARDTLKSATALHNTQAVTECLNDLARIALVTNRLSEAGEFDKRALETGDKFGKLDSILLAGQIAAAEHRYLDADRFFQELVANSEAETPLRWEAQSGQAGVRDAMGKTVEADRLYRAAIATVEKARGSINHDELRLSFLSSGIAVYGDYIDFLVRHGRANDALNQAELSRARTLAEGLASEEPVRANAAVHPEAIARRLRATVLTYWLGEKHSYLWVITPAKTTLVPLPPAGEIAPLVKPYRQAQVDGADVLHTATVDGEKLYELLVAPAKKLIRDGSRVVVLPDGALYNLNFETLIVPEPQPHFWIEDATLTTANSLTLLASGAARSTPFTARTFLQCGSGSHFGSTGPSSIRASKSACATEPSLLLVGDALQANADFPPLPQAPKEMALIEKYFPADERAVLSREKATASAYLASNPERYSYLHFVTHGTASRTRPLESAVILSPESSEGDAYKLYAREIVKHRLNAQLVTISACNGSGTRAYSGEGLVGLSWAFLRAGAHNVIGALWEVSDTATPQLMDQMYSELASGKDPATALRDAKLKFLHSANVFAKPFYWAPFQLYSGT